MFFYVSKIAWFFLTPSNVLAVSVFLGLLLAFTRFQTIGLTGALTASILLLFAGLSPLGYWLLIPLETRFERPATLPENVDAIILLGGFADTREGRTVETADLNEASDRLLETMKLAVKYPDAKIVLSGGQARFLGGGVSEAAAMQSVLADLGYDPDRFVVEAKSRNTAENASKSLALLNPRPGETHLLVTSAFHMPRSVGVFRAAGWGEVIPYPVDNRTIGMADATRPFTAVADGLKRVDMAVREWIGLVAYFVTARTPQFLPSPVRGNESR